MKTYSIFLSISLWFWCSCIAFAQQPNIQYTLKVLDNQGRPMANTDVTFTEMQSKQKVNVRTNSVGVATYTFTSGRFWQISVLKITDYYDWQFELKPMTGSISRTITYDYQHYLRITRPVIDRSKLNLVTTRQNFTSAEKATEKEAIVKIEIQQANKQPLENFPVQLTCYALATTYTAYTDAKGTATFKVPIQQDYEIDIDGIASYDYVDIPNVPRYSAWKKFVYEPTVVKETIKNDTIRQELTPENHSTSSRVMATLNVRGGENGSPANNTVYLCAIKTKKVYVGQTDSEGKVRFLLPKGDAYMINFRFQHNVDVFNLQRHKGIGYSNKTLTYSPSERLQYPERFLPTPDNLYLVPFQNFFTKQFPKPKEGETLLTHAKFYNQINEKSTQAILQIGFSAETQSANAQLADNLNLAFVIDKSGSMMGEERIDNVKEALQKVVQKLRDNDIISITVFDDEARVLVAPQKVGNQRKEIQEQIARIEADNGTNIWAGLELGYKNLAQNFKKNKTNRVILLSDGYGGDNPVETIAKSKAENEKGYELSAVGVGEDYNLALLQKLATQGGGLIELTKKAVGIQEAFINELNHLISPIAENAKIEILYNKQLLFAQLYGFPLEEKREGKLVAKLPKIYAGMADQIGLIKFTLVNPTQAIEKEPVTIITKYFDLRTQQQVKKEIQVTLSWSPVTGELEYQMEKEDKKLYGVALMNYALKNMAEAVLVKDYKKAKETLTTAHTEIKKLFPQADDKDIQQLMDNITQYTENLTNLLSNLQNSKK
jgi:secreted protein with Ig-like and vWFA domain